MVCEKTGRCTARCAQGNGLPPSASEAAFPAALTFLFMQTEQERYYTGTDSLVGPVCKQGRARKIDAILKAFSAREEAVGREKPILCGSCRHAVTSRAASIEVNRSHEHTFYNPTGVVFRIGCFSMAKGCLTVGEPTLEFTWFPGFSWTYAHCGKCHIHLGWLFASEQEGSFFGLILNKLDWAP